MAKLTTQEMQALRASRPDIAPGMVFEHYKGGVYQVIKLTIDTDTANLRVVYKRIDGPDFDAVAEEGIEFDRRIEEWEAPRFIRIGDAVAYDNCRVCGEVEMVNADHRCLPCYMEEPADAPKAIARCMGINCRHLPGTCTATQG